MSTPERPPQNTILYVEHGLQYYFDTVCEELADIEFDIGSFTAYADIRRDPGTFRAAQLSYATLERSDQPLSPRSLNAFSLGHIAAQLCTRFDGTVLLTNHSGDEESAASQDFHEILDTYFERSHTAHSIARAFLDIDIAPRQNSSTELYMAGAAMLLADSSNQKLHELEQQINQL